MGYEPQLVVIEAPYRDEETGVPNSLSDGKAYGRAIASVNLGKVMDSGFEDLVHRSITIEKDRIETEGWRYAFYQVADGNTQVATDKYGDPVSPVDLDELVDVVRAENVEPVSARLRFVRPALEGLQSTVKDGLWPHGVVVLHYGH